jgi:biopolymer transport protein TolQ
VYEARSNFTFSELAMPGLQAVSELAGQSPSGVPGQPLGIIDMVSELGSVELLVLVVLGYFSVVCWGIYFYKRRELRRAAKQSERFLEVFWEAKSLSTIHTTSLELKASPVAQMFRAGYQEVQRLAKAKRGTRSGGDDLSTDLGGIENVERTMRRAMTQEITRLEHRLTFLGTTAATAPFIGLFGTVWGIMTAFRGLSTAHSSSIQAVAPGIAGALIATAAGLAAAIPALMQHNAFARQIRVLSAEMENFKAEFLNIAERHLLK